MLVVQQKGLPAWHQYQEVSLIVWNCKLSLYLFVLFMRSDFRKLQRDFPEANASRMIAQSRDLGEWCNDIMGSSERWSLERLVMFIVSDSEVKL